LNWWNTSPAVLSHWFCVAISLIMHLVSYYAINQSIDQSIDQSINHSTINQPTSQWINQSTTQSINQSINQSITQSTNQCISLTGAEMAVLANKLGYEKEVVRVWFCNRRQALKNASKRFKSDNSESSTATSWAFTKRLRIQYSYQLSFHKETPNPVQLPAELSQRDSESSTATSWAFTKRRFICIEGKQRYLEYWQ